jgi:hypothetical protein
MNGGFCLVMQKFYFYCKTSLDWYALSGRRQKMQRFTLMLLVLVLPFGFAGNCAIFQSLFPLSYELSSLVTTHFVLHLRDSEEILNSTEIYIENEEWGPVLDNWFAQDSKRRVLIDSANSVGVYLRTALLDCYGTDIEGELYTPPWHLRATYRALLNRGCMCFADLTDGLFLER